MTHPADKSLPPAPAEAPAKDAPRKSAVRWRKPVSAVFAGLAFLGLGGLFGQWLVHRIGDAVSGDNPPAGFNELYAAWRQTAQLNENLLTAGGEANRNLEKGTSFTGRTPPPELQDALARLRRVRATASDLAGQVQSIDTQLSGARTSLLTLIALEETAANSALGSTLKAYNQYGGQPIYGGSGDFAPIFSNELRSDAVKQDSLVREVSASLGQPARRFHRPEPKVRGWNRLVFPHATSDTPPYSSTY
jgi:hypothetical protein